MTVKLGLSHYGNNIDCGCLKTGCWKRIFGPSGEEVTGGWKRLHNEELHNLYASSNQEGWAVRGM